MHILVATTRTQGLAPDDENDCADGELVCVTPLCGRALPGKRCGCEYLFTGLSTHGHTSTAVVEDLRGVGREEVLATIRDALCDDCYPPVARPRAAESLLRLAAAFPVGTVVERSTEGLRPRFSTGPAPA